MIVFHLKSAVILILARISRALDTGGNYRGDVAIIYDLTGNGDKQLKLFNNESYDIIYQEIRNTGISLNLYKGI
jgi:hypothetical protein